MPDFVIAPGDVDSTHRFLVQPQFEMLSRHDEHLATSGGSSMQLLVTATWPELDRSTRALNLFERELRRCARAAVLAQEKQTGFGSQSTSPPREDWMDELAEVPGTAGHRDGAFRIRHASGPGLAVVVSPEGPVAEVLALFPLASLAFAMSVFGHTFDLCVHTVEPWRGPIDVAGADPGLLDPWPFATCNGSDGHVDEAYEDVPGRAGFFRTIGRSRAVEGASGLARVGVVLGARLPSGSTQVIHAQTRPV